MSRELPKGTLNRARSGFAMIDPETELYSHKRGRAQHVAISYVWSEWKDTPADPLPNWHLLRSRLLELVGGSASSFMKAQTGHRRDCWLDSKCIAQDSPEDKAYWIPRMDEVYSEARCTVLLLRGLDLRPLIEAEKLIGCHVDDDDHSCLLTQSCSSIADWDSLDEAKLIDVLQRLSQGNWRKRAWIFQEILLSKEYILSGERDSQLKLSDCGVLAGLLFRRHAEMSWLGDFAEWCRRLHYLRLRYLSYTLSADNILQMAQPLEATVHADKYYALCGILRIKDLRYNGSHTAEEALQAVIAELTRHGRLSWLYAIRPSPGSNHQQGLWLQEASISTYIDHPLENSASFYAKPQVSSSRVGFKVIEAGTVYLTIPISKALEETIQHVAEKGVDFAREHSYMRAMPRLLHTLAWEAVSPLLQKPCIVQLRSALGLDSNSSAAEVIWELYALQSYDEFLAEGWQRGVDGNAFRDFAVFASQALKDRVTQAQEGLSLILWQGTQSKSAMNKSAEQVPGYEIAVGDTGVPVGAKVCKVYGSPGIMFAAEYCDEVIREITANWKGSLFPIWDRNSNKGTTSKILLHLKSRMTGNAPRTRQLNFALATRP